MLAREKQELIIYALESAHSRLRSARTEMTREINKIDEVLSEMRSNIKIFNDMVPEKPDMIVTEPLSYPEVK